MAALLAALTDDLVKEFLLRLPPKDPASLVRATLVCRRWCRILADRGFRRRFFEHHHWRPPMLGFFHDTYGATENGNPLLFTTTSSFRLHTCDLGFQDAIDAHHARVLLASMGSIEDPSACRLAIWDPMTSDLVSLPTLPWLQTACFHFTWKAVLLCTSTPSDSSDHLDCRRGPFLVVFVSTLAKEVYTYVYSSQAGAWSHTASAAREPADHSTLLFTNALTRNAVVGNAIYFRLQNQIRILKYDLGVQEISSVDLPSGCHPGPKICSRLQNMVDWKLPEWTSQGFTYGQWRPVRTGLSHGH